jgi:hypothetical protein
MAGVTLTWSPARMIGSGRRLQVGLIDGTQHASASNGVSKLHGEVSRGM